MSHGRDQRQQWDDTDTSFGEGKWDYTGIEVLNRPEPINEPPAHLEEGIAASLFIDLRIN